MEFFYKGQLVGTINNPKAEEIFDLRKIGTGCYQIKATANKTGAYRYAWVKVGNVSENLTTPTIVLSPETPDGQNNWYKTPVNVTITTDNENNKEIHYRIVRNGIVAENEEDIKYTGSFTIDTIGITDIYAWSTDGGEYQSEETNKEIKIDNKKPVVTYKESSNKEAVNNWYRADVEIQIEGEDEHSGIDCYYYKIQGQNTDWLKRSTKEKLLVTSEGITTIVVKVEDKAGNQSEEKEITIQKDTTVPDTAVISFKSHDKNSITVDATSNDNESGIGSYTFEYRLSTEDANNWKTLANGIVTSTAGKVTYTYSTLAEGEYALRVRIKDKAGNEKISNVIIQTTQLNEAPVFSSQPTVARVSNSNSSLTISAVAQDADGDQLTYTLYTVSGGTESIATGVNQNPITASQGTRVTFTKTGLGNYTTHSFKIKVSDGKEENMSNQASGTTYCLASYCSGGGTRRTKCSTCNGTGSVSSTSNCSTCKGTGIITNSTNCTVCGR